VQLSCAPQVKKTIPAAMIPATPLWPPSWPPRCRASTDPSAPLQPLPQRITEESVSSHQRSTRGTLESHGSLRAGWQWHQRSTRGTLESQGSVGALWQWQQQDAAGGGAAACAGGDAGAREGSAAGSPAALPGELGRPPQQQEEAEEEEEEEEGQHPEAQRRAAAELPGCDGEQLQRGTAPAAEEEPQEGEQQRAEEEEVNPLAAWYQQRRLEEQQGGGQPPQAPEQQLGDGGCPGPLLPSPARQESLEACNPLAAGQALQLPQPQQPPRAPSSLEVHAD